MSASQRVKGNDWGVLDPPAPGTYTPRRSVSIVIPAYRAHASLPHTLAALRAQTYPAHLLEVVVVDDGDGAPLDLPEVRPGNTRVVRAAGSWGRANACRAGAAAAEGEVIHWLDADMVPCRDEVALQMRWHHILDHAVVLGHKLFVDANELPPATEVHQAVLEDRLQDLLAGRWVNEHEWVEKIWRRTNDLRSAGFRAFHVHVGATASVGQDLYADAGGMDLSLKLGEDIELGYRLAMKGAVFVAERGATSWHLGRSNIMKHQQQIQRYNAPFVAQRIPDFRKFRQAAGRTYKVPYIDVVVEAKGHDFEQVKYSVDGVLQALPHDLHCRLVGPWSALHDERHHPLGDSQLELRLLREEYESEPRVTLVEKPERTAFPVQFQLQLPVGWRPGPETLNRVTREMQRRSQGLRSILLPDGRVARLERTAAFERALRVRDEGESVDDVVDTVSETWWSDGLQDGFEHLEHPSPSLAPEPPAPEPVAVTPPANPVETPGHVIGRVRSRWRDVIAQR